MDRKLFSLVRIIWFAHSSQNFFMYTPLKIIKLYLQQNAINGATHSNVPSVFGREWIILTRRKSKQSSSDGWLQKKRSVDVYSIQTIMNCKPAPSKRFAPELFGTVMAINAVNATRINNANIASYIFAIPWTAHDAHSITFCRRCAAFCLELSTVLLQTKYSATRFTGNSFNQKLWTLAHHPAQNCGSQKQKWISLCLSTSISLLSCASFVLSIRTRPLTFCFCSVRLFGPGKGS